MFELFCARFHGFEQLFLTCCKDRTKTGLQILYLILFLKERRNSQIKHMQRKTILKLATLAPLGLYAGRFSNLYRLEKVPMQIILKGDTPYESLRQGI